MQEVRDTANHVATLANPKSSAAAKGRAAKALIRLRAQQYALTQSAAARPHTGLMNLGGPPRARRARPRRRQPASVAAPAAVGTTVTHSPSVPMTTRFRRRELFHTIHPSGTGFEVQAFAVNPGLNEIFPWLHAMAAGYDKYAITSMAISYVPHCGTDDDGAVYLSWDPDPDDALPTGKTQMANYAHSVNSSVWKGFTWNIPCDNVPRFIRSGTVAGTLNTYDFGQLIIATQGASNTQKGDLYVEYDLVLRDPHLLTERVSDYWVQHLLLDSGSVSKNTLYGTLPFGYRGRRIVDPTRSDYTSNVARLYISECPSYNYSGTRRWAFTVALKLTGTGVAGPTVGCTNGNVTVNNLGYTTYSTTDYANIWTFVSAVDPTGSYVTIDVTGSTSITQFKTELATYAEANIYAMQS